MQTKGAFLLTELVGQRQTCQFAKEMQQFEGTLALWTISQRRCRVLVLSNGKRPSHLWEKLDCSAL